MALMFNTGAYLEKDVAIVSGAPLTMACWFNVPDIANAWFLMSVTHSGSTNNWFRLDAWGQQAGDPVAALTRGSSLNKWALSTSGYSADTWHHACARFSGVASRDAFLDGGSKGSETTSVTPVNLDRTSVGRVGDSSPESNGDAAKIDWPCAWNVALTDAEIAMLAAGAHPSMVRPQSIVGGPWDMYSTSSPVRDLWGDNSLTITGGVAKAAPPRIYYPSRPRVGVTAAVAATKSLPIFRYPHHNLVR